MNDNHTAKKVFIAQPTGIRRKSRQNLIWIDGLEKDLPVLRTKNWRTVSRRRLAWKRQRTSLGCRATEEGRRSSLTTIPELAPTFPNFN
ncbi:uncharacterized protein TNCV_232841 [Trichonephila clavipes]|nr:uncharacterized protein TNCV_232841 [Trichonephila clavipes]